MSFLAKDANGTNQNLPLYDPAYRFASSNFSVNASPTAIVQLKGAASTKVRVKQITVIIATAATAQPAIQATVNLRGAAASGGTPSTRTPGSFDSAQAAAAATLTDYSGAPTLSSLTANVGAKGLGAPANSYSVAQWDFTNRGDRALTLSSASEYLTIELSAQPAANTQTSYEIQWEEGTA